MNPAVWYVPGTFGLMRLTLSASGDVEMKGSERSWHRYRGYWKGVVVRWNPPDPPVGDRIRINNWLREATAWHEEIRA